MTINDVIALSKAGFTSEQIMQMSQVEQQPVMQPQVQQIQQPVMQPQVQQPVMQPQVQQPVIQPQVQQPVIQPQVQQPQVQQPDPFKQLFEQMTGIKQAIQSSNLQNSQMQVAAPQTTDDILASIIQPTKPKEDK